MVRLASLFGWLSSLPPRRLFLVDGLGALLSAFVLSVILVRFEDTFGMPRVSLLWLAAIAAMLSLFSISCSLRDPEHWRLPMRLIGSANLLYCCLTVGLVIYFRQALSSLGFSYFAGELVVVVALAIVELKSTSSAKHHSL